MKGFTSKREQRLWLCVLLVQVAIFATLGLAGTLAGTFLAMDKEFLSGAFFVIFVGLIAVSIWAGWRPGRREIGVLGGDRCHLCHGVGEACHQSSRKEHTYSNTGWWRSSFIMHSPSGMLRAKPSPYRRSLL